MMPSRSGPAALLCEGRMDESIAEYRKALLDEVIANGDEPENACMRAFERVKRGLEQYERWVWQHRGRRDLDDAEWL